jgi:hypothetical protein
MDANCYRENPFPPKNVVPAVLTRFSVSLSTPERLFSRKIVEKLEINSFKLIVLFPCRRPLFGAPTGQSFCFLGILPRVSVGAGLCLTESSWTVSSATLLRTTLEANFSVGLLCVGVRLSFGFSPLCAIRLLFSGVPLRLCLSSCVPSASSFLRASLRGTRLQQSWR